MNDEDLKKRFRDLRVQDARKAPSFEELTAVRPRRRANPVVVLVPALAAAAAVVLWIGVMSTSERSAAPVAVDRPPPPPRLPARAGAPAALPLDFLLESTPISVRLDTDPTEGLP